MTRLQVGRIGRAHGIRGEVTVTPLTDDPAARFAVGNDLTTDSVTYPVLTVSGARHSGPVQVVGFDGIVDRNTAELLRGVGGSHECGAEHNAQVARVHAVVHTALLDAMQMQDEVL